MVFRQAPVGGYYTSVEDAEPEDRLLVTLESGEHFAFRYNPTQQRLLAEQERSSASAWEAARKWCKERVGDTGFKIWISLFNPKREWETRQPQVGSPLTLIVANTGTSGLIYEIPASKVVSVESVLATDIPQLGSGR